VIEWGNLYSESFQELKAEHEEKSEKVINLEKEIETMKTDHETQLQLLGETIKETGIIQAPVETEVKSNLTKADIVSMRLDEQRKNK
jgi:hypothetical protein